MQLPVLTILFPLFGAFVAVAVAWSSMGRSRQSVMPIAVSALGLSAVCAAVLFVQVLSTGPQTYLLGGWAPPWGISLSVDPLSALMLVVVSAGALLNLFAFSFTPSKWPLGKTPAFLGLYLLATAGHLGIVATGDVFNLFVFIEVAALSSYALLSMGGPRATFASLNYLLVGSVGASLYLLGVGYLYITSGSLNMLDIADILTTIPLSTTTLTGFVVLMLGLWVKMAVFPFHAWLPAAYSSASPAVSGLLAPMTTKVMAYVIVRMLTTVFPPDLLAAISGFSSMAVWLACVAIIAGALMALAQQDLRRMLCFILVAEVGYMLGGAFLGNATAMTGTILHILADAAMTLTLFLAVGSIVVRTGGSRIDDMDGMFTTMPVTMLAFTAGALSMIGVPPFCGFFSKWYLLSGALEAGHWVFAGSLLLSSLVNVFLFFRVFERAFFRKPATASAPDSSDWYQLAPMCLIALLLPVIGLATGGIIQQIIQPALKGVM
jgi:multicomponent Na+:H+ antiporter subunit D